MVQVLYVYMYGRAFYSVADSSESEALRSSMTRLHVTRRIGRRELPPLAPRL